MGSFEVDLFPKEVDSPDHPEAEKFKLLMEQVADDYDCELLSFEVDEGTVTFSFDSDALNSEILKVLHNNKGV